VVLERGEVANTWRNERWDSLRLLTPNWQSRLPGFQYDGDDPDGFMTMPEVIGFIDGYAKHIEAPVQTHTTVTSVRPNQAGYEVVTDDGRWEAPTVVLATGGFNLASLPPVAELMPASIESITPLQYRQPDLLPEGETLVIGASATGIQIAEEIHASGRPVTLSVGEHVRLPRVYRGKDIMWWLERTGVLDERWDEVDDLVRARNIPSPQLVGTPERRTLDLNALVAQGVRLVGRIAGIVDGKAQLSGSLRNFCNLADLKMTRLLDTIDEFVDENGLASDVGSPERFAATKVEKSPPLSVDLSGFSTVIWATGFRPDYSWLHARVLDRKGRLRHDAGLVTGAPGLYRIGLNMLRRRKSSFIHGAEDDARDITDHLGSYLGVGARV
jgi:putative flavoprotein involved in K+ transport